MKHEKKKIIKIVDEIMFFLFANGSTEITTKVTEEKERHVIYIWGNFDKKNKDNFDKLIKLLSCPRQRDMEEYYWELTGDSDQFTELTLVGMMTDEVQVDMQEDSIELILYRNKN